MAAGGEDRSGKAFGRVMPVLCLGALVAVAEKVYRVFGLDMHSADRIHPEWQELGVGGVVRSREDRPGMRVEILEPERVLSNRSEAGDRAWTFALV